MKLFNAHGQFSGVAITGSVIAIVVGFLGVVWYDSVYIAPQERSRCESIGATRYHMPRSITLCRLPDGTLKAMPSGV